LTQTAQQFERGRKYLLWDGDCGFCARSVELAHRLNAGDFELVSYQSIPETELRVLGLSHHRCSQELKAITANGQVLGGAFAVNYFLWFHPQWRAFIALLYALPILILAEVVVYRIVAQNRGAISRVLGFNACSISARQNLKKEK
jgi:predicted DCC family thiol-disulfide oxidoreductase YuxK